MTQSTDREIGEIKSAIDANNKAIADLALSINGLREEMRLGFVRSEGQVSNVETKLDAKIDAVKGELRVMDIKSQNNANNGFWGSSLRWIAILAFGGLFVAFLLS
jgi:formate dehydrogenase assembly factor FdhD